MASSFGIYSTKNYAGTDQGVDFTGAGQIPALAPAVVTAIGSTHIIEGGTYPYVVYQLKGGPYKGQYVYTMESFVPHVHVGDHLKAGQSIGYATGNGVGIETGFNQGGTSLNPVAPLYPNPHSPKPAGVQMWKYIQGQIGAGPPVTSPAPTSGLTDKQIAQAAANAMDNRPTDPLTGAVEGPAKAIAWVFENPLRLLEVFGGGILLLMGLYLLVRQVGLAADVPLPSPAKAAADAIPAARAARTARHATQARKHVGPSETRRSRVVHHYHPTGSPAAERHERDSRPRRDYDPATAEIPF